MRCFSMCLFLASAGAFAPAARLARSSTLKMGADRVSPPVRERIETLLDNKVVLFMKGNKSAPKCGFSNTAVKVLETTNTSFETFDVLEDPEIRQGIKEYSDWPTIPQLYVNKEFVGGSDILMEMYKTGELQEMVEVASAS